MKQNNESILHCRVCGQIAAHVSNGRVVVYSHDSLHNVELDLRDVLSAMTQTARRLIMIRDFVDKNKFLQFILK